MQDFEKLGLFYLGRGYDPQHRALGEELLLHESRKLTTHAVCLGMTGSGKTGLCITLLEEAAIDGIPALVIDPKGDMANLLLAFPGLQGSDLLPWIDREEAARRGTTAEAWAEEQAARWREGLAAWGQDPERIARYRSAVDLALYTPGSTAVRPLSVLRSLTAPPASGDPDALRERIQAAATGLLTLLDRDADPLQSREHILLANLLDWAWQRGRDLDLAGLIRLILDPPFPRLGVLALDDFIPARERQALAMRLNNLLASPGFAAWLEGEPLDVGALLYTAEGKPRVSVLSIAHLGDQERMFFVSTLLEEVVAWMRAQQGTSSLRAVLYMDEVFGYLPPTAMPPTKKPLLTLLKQARAFGLGVVLATQNPVDLDYKALSNAGTWFIGRLQTERDRARVMDGLEGAAGAGGRSFDRAGLERAVAALEPRVFLLHDVHRGGADAGALTLFQTRWTLSYLAGPLSRAQQLLLRPAHTVGGDGRGGPPSGAGLDSPSVTSPRAAEPAGPPGGTDPDSPPVRSRRAGEPAGSPGGSGPDSLSEMSRRAAEPQSFPASSPAGRGGAAADQEETPDSRPGKSLVEQSRPGAARTTRPSKSFVAAAQEEGAPRLPADLPVQYVVRPEGAAAADFRPALLARAQLHFVHAPARLDSWRPVTLLAPFTGAGGTPAWEQAQLLERLPELEESPRPPARFAPVPASALLPRALGTWQKSLKVHLAEQAAFNLWSCPPLKLFSEPGEKEADFRIRLAQAAREQRDEALEKLRRRQEPRQARLLDQLDRARDRTERQQEQAERRNAEVGWAAGASLVSALFGNSRGSGLGRVVRAAGRAGKEQQDVERASARTAELQLELERLEQELQAEAESLRRTWSVENLPLEKVPVHPRKGDLSIDSLVLVWI